MSKLKEQSKITERNNSITERKIKNERGITLIALIITIIILLILAGITINLALAPDGIIKRAQTAGEEYRKEQDKEVAGINELTNLLDKIGAEEESKGTKWTYDHKTQTVTNGTDTFEIGDYVNYENPASGSYTALATSTGMDRAKEIEEADIGDQTFEVAKNPLRWRVLGVDEATSGLKLVGSPIKSNRVDGANDPYFYLYGANGYINGITELKKISEIFKNDLALEARSITMKDICEILGVTEKQEYYGDDEWVSDGTVAKGIYTPESFLKNEKVEKVEYIIKRSPGSIVFETTEDYLNSKEFDDPGPSIAIDNEKIFNMLFKNILSYDESEREAQFWLGTTTSNFFGVDDSNGGMIYGWGLSSMQSDGWMTSLGGDGPLFLFDGFECMQSFAVRPVVILKSDLPTGTIKKSDNQKEEELWKYAL